MLVTESEELAEMKVPAVKTLNNKVIAMTCVCGTFCNVSWFILVNFIRVFLLEVSFRTGGVTTPI